MICQGLLKKPGSDHVIFSMIHSFACTHMYVYVYCTHRPFHGSRSWPFCKSTCTTCRFTDMFSRRWFAKGYWNNLGQTMWSFLWFIVLLACTYTYTVLIGSSIVHIRLPCSRSWPFWSSGLWCMYMYNIDYFSHPFFASLLDQFRFLGNCPLTCTPPLSHHFALSEK